MRQKPNEETDPEENASENAVATTGEKAVRAAPMTPVQRELAAKMYGSGCSAADIQDQLGITTRQLAALKKLDRFQELASRTRDEVAAAVVDHRPVMARLAQTARAALQDIIENSDNSKGSVGGSPVRPGAGWSCHRES